MTRSGPADHRRSRRRTLGHDDAGEPYASATVAQANDGTPLAPPIDPVASRSTTQEAHDLLMLRHAKSGDTSAFANLVRSNDETVRKVVQALTDDDDPDAVCTRIYLRAYRGLPVAPNVSPRIWLLRIADGVARDTLRHRAQQRAPRATSEAAMPAPAIPVDTPAEERLAVATVDAGGLTVWEAARVVGCGVDELRLLLAQGRTRVNQELLARPPADHREDFWNDLGRHLLIEHTAPPARRVRSMGAERGPKATAGDAQRTKIAARGMAVRFRQQHPRVFPWRRLLLTGAVLATVAVFVAVALSLTTRASRHDAALGDTADKTLGRLDTALARNTVVRGTVRITTPSRGTAQVTYQFVRSNTGSWRITAQDGSVDEGYDVSTGTMVTVRRDAQGGGFRSSESTGLAPGPPEETASTDRSPGDVLAEAIRIVRSGTSGTVRTDSVPIPGTAAGSSPTTEARQVWVISSRLSGRVAPALLAGSGNLGAIRADRADLVADQSLALPTSLTLRYRGHVVATVRFSGLSIAQQQPSDSTFSPPLAPGASPSTTSAHFKSVTVGGVGATGLPTPSYLPGGYVLTAAAIDSKNHIAVACYRNGSRQLVLTSLALSPSGRAGDDPLGVAADGRSNPQHSTINSGALAGADLYVANVPIAHAWADGARTRVIAVGDPTTKELTRVLSSLRR